MHHRIRPSLHSPTISADVAAKHANRRRPFVNVVIEPRVGGRWFERAEDGTETSRGDILAWKPPRRLLLAWRIGAGFAFDPRLLAEVELTFEPNDHGTRVTLEHRHLERFGDNAARMAEQPGGGWPKPIEAFQAYTNELHAEAGGIGHG